MHKTTAIARRAGAPAFVLVATLIIISVLAIVAVGFLVSMLGERQTTDAYTSKTRADQAAQAGVESAMAVLQEAFRDYPDSATVWDPYQSANTGTPVAGESATTVNTAFNEGTSLYLRATSQTQTVNGKAGVTVANPTPNGAGGVAATASNDPAGNDPNDPACQNFVLPLISGVPGGYAQLASAVRPTVTGGNAAGPNPNDQLPSFNLAEVDPANQTDPTKQYCTDLNVRRYKGDIVGAISSPPSWNGTPAAGSGTGPKPARALWVNLSGQDQRITGRYAYWTEDESFRANNSYLTGGTAPVDNMHQPPGTGTSIRSLQPGDLTLLGPLTAAGDSSAGADATAIVNTRSFYPGGFFPDPLAFAHSATGTGGTPSLATSTIDALRYLTTNQSGALNLTRHGSQRLNLNALVPTTAAAVTTQTEVDQVVQTLAYHLPNFGERFYRTSTATSPGVLNDATQVPGSPVTTTPANNHSNIYLYKVAANLLDYADLDHQPTVVMAGGTVAAAAKPSAPLDEVDGNSNTFWAFGKESAPFIQEVAVRFRPVVYTQGNTYGFPKGHYDLQVDYYIEVWNMTDQDIYAGPQPSPHSQSPHLNGATLCVRDQQQWTGYPAGDLLAADPPYAIGNEVLSNNKTPNDWEIDLTNNVVSYTPNGTPPTPVPQNGNGGSSLGVVFRAGAVTVITTDPDCYKNRQYANYPYGFRGPVGAPGTGTVANPANVFFCQLKSGQREYSGKVTSTSGTVVSNGGMMLGGDFNGSIYSGTEISLVNGNGYLDIVRGAITKTGGPGSNFYTNTDKYQAPNSANAYNDYSFGSGLIGNIKDTIAFSFPTVTQNQTPSELGDPRTNNEQLSINIASNTSDGSHFVPGARTLGTPNAGTSVATLQPETTVAGQGWADYFTMPTGNANPTAATAPAVIADEALTSVGQLGDVFDPARVPGAGGIVYSRGGGRTFKIGQHDDRYSPDPTGNASPNNTVDYVSASTGWASWRLADVFDVSNAVELPACININGVRRDQGAALLAALEGFQFQPVTPTGGTGPVLPSGVVDPVIHGDGHASGANVGPAGLPLSTTDPSHGLSQLVAQMKARLDYMPPSAGPVTGPYGPFFERGELGEIMDLTGNGGPLFGVNPASAAAAANTTLVSSVDMNKTYDHSREELLRRIAQVICTRGDTFTVYAAGQSIYQANVNGPMKITGTQRVRVTFRLVPKDAQGNAFHPGYTTDASNNIVANTKYTTFSDTSATGRFAKPDHYDIQTLQTNIY